MIQKFIVTVESSDKIYASDLKNELDFAYKHGNAIFEVEETIETTAPTSGLDYNTRYTMTIPKKTNDTN